MKKALYIPDPYIRQLTEEVQKEWGFKSLRETVEQALIALTKRPHSKKEFYKDLEALQERVRQFIGPKAYDKKSTIEETKAFFDELSGGI